MIDQRIQASTAERLPAFRSKVDNLRPTYGFEAVSYTHLTLPTN